MSGFQHAPGTPERRAADRAWIEQHKTASVKNPSRYNVDTARAFGIVHGVDGSWVVLHRGHGDGGTGEGYDTLDELLDAGWTVD